MDTIKTILEEYGQDSNCREYTYSINNDYWFVPKPKYFDFFTKYCDNCDNLSNNTIVKEKPEDVMPFVFELELIFGKNINDDFPFNDDFVYYSIADIL